MEEIIRSLEELKATSIIDYQSYLYGLEHGEIEKLKKGATKNYEFKVSHQHHVEILLSLCGLYDIIPNVPKRSRKNIKIHVTGTEKLVKGIILKKYKSYCKELDKLSLKVAELLGKNMLGYNDL